MRFLIAVVTIFCLATHAGSQGAKPEPLQTFVIAKPTIIAFVQRETGVGANREDEAEAQSDFDFSAAQVEGRLREAGIVFKEFDGIAFRIRRGKHVHTFRSRRGEIGYYLIAPGKRAHVEYGVMTDVDLVGVARQYFGSRIR